MTGIRSSLIAAGVAILMVVGLGAYAFGAGHPRTVTVCATRSGAVRGADAHGHCPRGTSAVALPAAGQRGPSGPSGPPGAPSTHLFATVAGDGGEHPVATMPGGIMLSALCSTAGTGSVLLHLQSADPAVGLRVSGFYADSVSGPVYPVMVDGSFGMSFTGATSTDFSGIVSTAQRYVAHLDLMATFATAGCTITGQVTP